MGRRSSPIDLSAAFHAIRAAFAGMKERRWGRIINIASAHGLVASPFKSAYVAAKHGIVGLTKVVALEGAEYGVTCQRRSAPATSGRRWSRSRSTTRRRRTTSPRDEVIRDVLLAQQPNKRFATVEEMGALDRLPRAATRGTSITGTALPVDGGWTAH